MRFQHLMSMGALSAALCFLWLQPAQANYSASRAWFERQTIIERRNLQFDLILTGHYNGFADATFGRNTYNALIGFEQDMRRPQNGILHRHERRTLAQAADRVRDVLGFRDATDSSSGFHGPMALGYLEDAETKEIGKRWRGADGGMVIDTFAYRADEVSLAALYSELVGVEELGTITYERMKDDWFVQSGKRDDWSFYVFAQNSGRANQGIVFQWHNMMDETARVIAVYTTANARFFDVDLPRTVQSAPDVAEAPDGSKGDAPEGSLARTGSGFFVSRNGILLTNNHVVDGCSAVSIVGYGSAEVLRANEEHDLAVVYVPDAVPPAIAKLSDKQPGLGSDVTAGGFPLADLLGDKFSIAPGKVTSRSGIDGAENHFAISAGIQPGNSGGPVVDAHGEVVGIVVGKLNDAVLLEFAETTSANFSFAIRVDHAVELLRPFAMSTEALTADKQADFAGPKSVEDIADEMENYTVQVLCK